MAVSGGSGGNDVTAEVYRPGPRDPRLRRSDGVGGTADVPDVDFGEDQFNPTEGFTGTEDTLSRIAASLFG